MPNSVYDAFPQSYKETLKEISDNFEENLTRIIGDDFERDQMYSATTTIPLKDIGIHGIEPKNLKTFIKTIELVGAPKYSLTQLKVNFRDLSLDVQIDIKDINVCVQHVVDGSVREEICSTGKLPDLRYNALIGMNTEEDSFVPKNFHNNFQWKLSEFDLQANTDPIFQSNTSLESIGNKLIPYFANKFYREITGTVVDFSLSELLIDEPEQIREHDEHRTSLSDFKVDGWLQKLEGKSPIQFNLDFNFYIKDKDGTVIQIRSIANTVDLKNLKRTSPTSYFDDNLHVVSGELQESKCKLNYKKIELSGKTTEGTITATIYRNNVLMVFDPSKKKVQVNSTAFHDINICTSPDDSAVNNAAYPYLQGYLFEYYKALLAHIATLLEENF